MPKPKEEKNRSELNPERVEIELESDKFEATEQKEIVEMVLADYKSGKAGMETWLADRALDVQHYMCEKPSLIENLTKKEWQSDRNLGICPAVCDAYQATVLSTCWNPDTIHYVATESNDFDNKEYLERFTKWAVSDTEGNFLPEVDDYLHNKITQGAAFFKIYWKVWYDWVDRRIPKKSGGYTIKTERVRFERGVIENIDNLEDVIFPEFGKSIQELPFFIHIIHKMSNEVIDLGNDGIFENITEEFVLKLKGIITDNKNISKEKESKLGFDSVASADLRTYPLDLYEWYGVYTNGGKTEKYRFIIEPITETFLSGKPLRKITRTGKIPFVGGPFIRIPGYIRGRSMPTIIAPIVNAINNVFNQKSDFQYVENMPYGFYNPDEGFTKEVYDLIPNACYPVAGKPSESVYFPNNSRSLAWAESDIRILLEFLERLTGAASYFQSRGNQSKTLGQDLLISEKSETRFGIIINRNQAEISEAVTMFINMYQDWAPPKLGDRVLGKDGKKIFDNLSIETLRGNYSAKMEPDIVSGSKAFDKEVKMWMFMNLQQSIWVNPQINPKGNYNLCADTIKALGMTNAERYLGKEPPLGPGESNQVEDEWIRFMQGEKFDPPEGENILEHLIGHMKQKAEKYNDLDKEYRPNFDSHLFKTQADFTIFIRAQQQQQIADMMAMKIIQARQAGLPDPDLASGMGGQGQPNMPIPGAGGV